MDSSIFKRLQIFTVLVAIFSIGLLVFTLIIIHDNGEHFTQIESSIVWSLLFIETLFAILSTIVAATIRYIYVSFRDEIASLRNRIVALENTNKT